MLQYQPIHEPPATSPARLKGDDMSHDQEKTGEGRNTLPVKEETSPLNGLGAIVGDTAAQGFDNLGAGADRHCGQYQYGGTMPIVAPAARVSPVVREVQL